MPHIDALTPWRIVIKGMKGQSGDGPGTVTITTLAATNVYDLTEEGIIDSSMLPDSPHDQIPAGVTFTAYQVSVPYDPIYGTGGYFWKIYGGDYDGRLVSLYTNDLSDDFGVYGDISLEQGFDRGPGDVLGIIEYPSGHLAGASINYNAPGELHFTLLVDDPNIHLPVPKQTHYVVEFKLGGEWVETFAGLIWDVDATETEAVFYGIDYLGLFQFVLDERFDKDEPNVPAPTGSYYNDLSVKQIVRLALTYAVQKPNSPVNFIVMGGISEAMDGAHIDGVYSTFMNILDFVVGMIQSHRAGTGIMTRVCIVKYGDEYRVNVYNDPGEDKPDLNLVYGELVQGYRVEKFGGVWASRADVVARDRDGIKVEFRAETGYADEFTYGCISQAAVIIETRDHEDLLRRSKQMAMDAAQLVRRIGVGLRLGSYCPLEEFDLCDRIQIDIQHGAVDTMAWNSNGWWVILGTSFESYDDGHWITNISVIPRYEHGGDT